MLDGGECGGTGGLFAGFLLGRSAERRSQGLADAVFRLSRPIERARAAVAGASPAETMRQAEGAAQETVRRLAAADQRARRLEDENNRLRQGLRESNEAYAELRTWADTVDVYLSDTKAPRR